MSKKQRPTIFSAIPHGTFALPLIASRIAAGFPSPADDHIEHPLDLNEYLIKHPAATFFMRVEGDSMIDAGIRSGDLLIIDRALQATHNKIIIAQLDGEFTVKRLVHKHDKVYLQPDNVTYQPIEITDEMDFEIWGVVVHVIHHIK